MMEAEVFMDVFVNKIKENVCQTTMLNG